ncbi:phosphatidate cytidylyltransferase [Selenomonas caprae]|uniref:Phosphatidate cytidylyltransferase n=1 Tax=Selenomonas caprae TaxID=2606905 RepID=A0A5D6WJ70_9FIRM|nr:phosphatidate cytidylyltransferase [Selenomonas caprae]MBQ1890473.1 phosphatidate cytidylyltransferase [Selenomonas sp.]TYZ26948.1 phosphatidate cytidylyltransferase [Selenomonas caprae]
MITRIITGLIGIALAAYVIQTGGTLFAGFALVLGLIAWFEYARAFGERGMGLTLLTGFLGVAALWYTGWQGNVELMVAAATLIVAIVLLESVLLRGSVSIMDAVTSVTGILYIGFPFAYMVMLRDWPETRLIPTQLGDFEFGCALIWIMFIGTWASDTFAYFTGSAIGRHKLCPSISPNKTVEGFLGSLVGTTAAVAGLGIFFALPVQEMAILGLAIAVLATLGDLVESVAKRYTGIKDSGSIIPGHGGIWDRFDSVLFTAPLVYYFVKFVGLAMK